jgi:hypothetical protein
MPALSASTSADVETAGRSAMWKTPVGPSFSKQRSEIASTKDARDNKLRLLSKPPNGKGIPLATSRIKLAKFAFALGAITKGGRKTTGRSAGRPMTVASAANLARP